MSETTLPFPRRDTYIVRVWFDEQVDPARRVWVQHLSSGQQAALPDLPGLLAFIEQWQPAAPGAAETQTGLR